MLPCHVLSETVFLLFILLPMVALAITNPITILQPSVRNFSASTELTLGPVPQDPRLRIAIQGYNQIPVSRTSLMMTCVNEISKLVSLDWNGQVRSFRSSQIQGYSDVAIFMNVRSPAPSIQTKVAVWGMYLTFTNTVIANRVKACDVDLYWDDVRVARIRVRPNPATSSQSMIGEQGSPDQRLLQELPALPSLYNTSGNLTDGSSNIHNDTSILKEPMFEADCSYLGDAETLNDIEVFATIMGALKNIAPVPKTSLVHDAFETGMRTVDARVQFQGPEDIPWHPPGPPYYQYQWVIRALHAMPGYMLSQGRLAELGVSIVVDGRRLGFGQLIKGEVDPVRATYTNISTV
ncbi:hypothetical protein IMSHALPRED_001633 [Imshaugia aleurites]|uniref:Uncharacterized protein n=1 Tax=Imshaugia aleurites TaxID=172621 RepID=A0A8H3J315_9LECA|nr:hypothetical protein IMSHALPRED_001633 [Imshaugia aleurites]